MPVVKLLNKSEYESPQAKTPLSAGLDLTANERIRIWPGEIGIVSTGIHVALPEGYELQIRSRSGLAAKGLFVLNSPGTIDPDYRGEIKVLLYNAGMFDTVVVPGMRIAQAVCSRYEHVDWEEVETEEDLGETERGTGGFGSTGMS